MSLIHRELIIGPSTLGEEVRSLNVGAADRIAPHWPVLELIAGSPRTAARFKPGAGDRARRRGFRSFDLFGRYNLRLPCALDVLGFGFCRLYGIASEALSSQPLCLFPSGFLLCLIFGLGLSAFLLLLVPKQCICAGLFVVDIHLSLRLRPKLVC